MIAGVEKNKILLYENDALLGADLNNRLKDLGYDVRHKAITGEKTIPSFTRPCPDLVIMDMGLCEGRDNRKVDLIDKAAEMWDQWGIPVVFLADPADLELLERTRCSYPFGSLLKPSQNGDLQTTVQMALHIAGLEAEKRKVETELREREKELKERNKELNCLYSISILFDTPGITIAEILRGIGEIIPAYRQYPANTCVRIVYENMEYISTNFQETPHRQIYEIKVHGKTSGKIEIYDLEKKPEAYTGPILRKDRRLLDAISERLGKFINRRLAEEALSESRECFATFMEQLPINALIKDEKSTVLFANVHMDKMLGASGWIGKTASEYFPPVLAEQALCDDRKVIQQGGVIVNDEAIPDRTGKTRLLETRKFPIKRNNKTPLIGLIGLDITERKRTEEELRETVARNHAILNALPDLMFVLSRDGTFLDYHAASPEMLYLPPERFLGKKVQDVFTENPAFKFLTSIEQAADSGNMQIAEFQLEVTPNRQRYFEARIVPYEGDKTLSIVQDITKRKLAGEERHTLQAQLQQAHKMEAIGTLAGGIAHDFNNMLQGIAGHTEILLKGKNEEDPEYHSLGTILKTVYHAATLVRRLLLFSRKVVSERRPINLNGELEQTVKILERTIPKMVDIVVRPRKNLWTINADSVQMEQILLNLAKNAADAMPNGGRLIIETDNITLNQGDAQPQLGVKPGRHVLLSVHDTGMGMDDVVMAHIFEPFFTTKGVGQGTGLGLASVYGIVKSHCGYITCTSEVGVGTTFNVYFPAIEQIEDGGEKEPTPVTPRLGTETILFVDDEDAIRNSAAKFLEGYGYTVITASSGEEATKIYSYLFQNIDLVVLDIDMPGMGGHRCLAEILKIEKTSKVIMTSGYAVDGRSDGCMATGAAGYVGKPYQVAFLLEKIRSILDKPE